MMTASEVPWAVGGSIPSTEDEDRHRENPAAHAHVTGQYPDGGSEAQIDRDPATP